MARFLKQSTAFTFRAGPFVDATDGVTAETGLTIGQADIQISKAGGAFAQTSASPTTTHDADGWYQCPLTATDTNTVGTLTVQIAMAGAAPVWHDFMVLPANVYDSLVAGSDYLDVSAVQIEGSDATDQINAACDAAIETYGLDHLVAASVTGTDVVDNSIVAKIVSSSATADWDDFVNTTDSLQANRDALPTTTSNPFILVDTTIATLASQTSFTLTAGSADDDAYKDCLIVVTDQSTSTQKAIGVVSDYVGSTRTVTLLSDPGIFTMATGDSVAIAAQSFAKLVDDIWDEVITGAQHNVNNSAAKFLREGSEAVALTGTAQAGAASTITLAAGASASDDIYNFERIEIIEGAGVGQSRLITDYDGTTKVATVGRAWTTNPDSTSVYAIMGAETDVIAINSTVAAAIRLALSSGQIIPGTVDTVTNTHTPTTTEFQADDITEATADHYNGRIIIFTSGALLGQATDITGYAAVGGIGQFTVTALTEAPANNDTFIIV